MSRTKAALCAALLILPASLALPSAPLEKRERPHGIPKRVPWTTSRVTGSPDPPPPYRVERVFPKLTFKNPTLLTNAPGTDRLFVGEQAGKLYSFRPSLEPTKADLFLDLTTELKTWDTKGKVRGIDAVYDLTFHPQFAKNRYCYVCYVLAAKDGSQLPEGSRVSRFRVTDTDPPRCDPKSEQILITWLGGGHNGGCLKFGPDGCLYVSTGDGTNPNPPDIFNTGQDISDLLSSVLRIDVDHQGAGKHYAVPKDNPFVKTPGARPEVWAYGFRNPWKMSFDRRTGDLWVGDVGWELWEMVYRVKRGGNYGWSVMEGRQQVRPGAKRGPTPILPPTLDFPHTEAASITGGYVYRGKRLKDLVGSYVCGDWVTGRLWATRFDGDKIVTHREIAQSPLHIVVFAEDNAGELYFMSYADDGAIFRLAPNEAAKAATTKFPRRLSETGLFASVKEHRPAPGVVPFAPVAQQWADYATAERFVALPGQSSARVYDRWVPIPGGFFSGQVFFPKDGVLAKTFFLETERGNAKSRRRLETQVLHFDGDNWHGYSYRWNDAQTDADLVPAAGADVALTVTDPQAPGGKRRQTWHFPGRAECLQCHNPWAGHVLAFNPLQLDRDFDYGGAADNQLRALRHAGLITPVRAPGNEKPPAVPRLVNPSDGAAGLDERARSYLHVNCSHCHQFGAGGTSLIDLRRDRALKDMNALDARPVQGTFDIPDAKILAPGDPYRSVLYYRMAKLGRGRMPHIGSDVVDECGLRLVHDWIRQLSFRADERALLARLRDPAVAAQQRTAAIDRLLSSPGSALLLMEELAQGRLPASVRAQVVAAAQQRPVPVRDLFERFVPDEQKVARLGNVIDAAALLARKGDAARGRELFFKSGSLCVNCHKVGGTGGAVGPDLSQIGKKYNRAQLLESILEPSKVIDPPYVAYLVETTDGKVLTGVVASKTPTEVVLRDAEAKEIRLPAAKVAKMEAQKKSLMPDQLLRDLTAEQAADLLEFLASLK